MAYKPNVVLNISKIQTESEFGEPNNSQRSPPASILMLCSIYQRYKLNRSEAKPGEAKAIHNRE